jgi:H/ACA ribonucleoprotein complex subunit 4
MFNNKIPTIPGLLNLDKPLNINSTEIIKKLKEIIKRKKIFPHFFQRINASGCLIISFSKFRNSLNIISRIIYRTVCVITTKHSNKNSSGVLEKYLKKDLYFTEDFLLNKRKIKIMEIKSFLNNNSKKKKNIFILFLKSKFKNLSHLGFDLIFKKKCNLNEIRQIKIGPISENDNLHNLHNIIDILWDLNFWKYSLNFHHLLIPNEFILKPLKRIIVKDSTVNSLCYGSNLMIGGAIEIERNISKGEEVLLITKKKEIIGCGEMNFNSEIISENLIGILVTLKQIIMKKNLYPKKWNLGTKFSYRKIIKSIGTFS